MPSNFLSSCLGCPHLGAQLTGSNCFITASATQSTRARTAHKYRGEYDKHASNASAGNRTRVTLMATMYSATRPPMPDTCLKNLCLQPARTHTPPLSIRNLTQPQSSASAVGTCTGDRCLSFMHKTLGDWLMCVVNHTACAYTQHTQICERDRTHLYTDTMFRHRDSNPGRSGESRVS